MHKWLGTSKLGKRMSCRQVLQCYCLDHRIALPTAVVTDGFHHPVGAQRAAALVAAVCYLIPCTS
jgi:hypothetical protein